MTHTGLFPDQSLHTARTEMPPPVIRTPGIQPPPLPNSAPIVDGTPSTDDHPSTRIGPTTTTTRQTSYRLLQAKNTSSRPAQGTNKRKHTGSRSVRVRNFEETPQDITSEEDDPGNFSGDGNSSGDSLSDVPACPKRQRTSRIVTRSSAQTSTTDAIMEGELNPALLILPQ